MARSEARLQFGIWRNGLAGLSPHSKLLYCVLLTEPTVNHAGIGAMRTSKWGRDAGLTVEETTKALQELTDGAFIVVDEDTEEVFVRTMIRNDGVVEQPYVLKGALKEALHTSSTVIRRALAAELRKLPPRQPDRVGKNGRTVTYPDPHAAADELDPRRPDPAHPEPPADPSETLSEGSSEKGFETLGGRGGGGGGGNSPSVATQVERTTGAQKRADSDEIRTAQEITRAYTERVPLSKFPAVLGIVRRGMKAGHPPDAIQAALLRLADEGRPVTVDALRVELEGLPTSRRRDTPRRPTADDKIAGWQSLKTGTDDRPIYALPGGEHP